MRTGMSQHTQMRQEIKINPRLYQAMDLLYMPLLDLQQHLKQELLNNPFLEMYEEDEDEDGEEAAAEDGEQTEEEQPKEEAADEIDWEEILLNGFDAGGRPEEHEEKEYFEPVTVDRRDLSDHLRDQVALLDLDERQLQLAEEFVGNINEDGYLACSLDEIRRGINEWVEKAAEELGRDTEGLPFYTEDECEAMLRTIQALDPPGPGGSSA